MVAGVGCGRKKKKLQRREKGWKEKREGRGSCAYRRWGFGFVVRLRRLLLVEEEGFCGVFKGWRSSGGEREKRERWLEEKNMGEAAFLAYFGPDFLLPRAIKSTSIYRRWKRAIFSTLEKTFSSWFGWEGSQPLAQSRHGALSNCQICSCRLSELASLGWCHVRLFARVLVKTIPRRRGMSGDPFRVRFGNFGSR